MVRIYNTNGRCLYTARQAKSMKQAVEEAVKHRISLHKANLCRANLKGANLFGARLAEADLRWSNLQGVNFCQADLSGADWHDALMDERVNIDHFEVNSYLPFQPRSHAAKVSDKKREQQRATARAARERDRMKKLNEQRRAKHDTLKMVKTVYKGAAKKLQFQARAASAALRQQMAQYKEQHP